MTMEASTQIYTILLITALIKVIAQLINRQGGTKKVAGVLLMQENPCSIFYNAFLFIIY